jgi:uncharacterized protein YjbJ (UPF0337 family)
MTRMLPNRDYGIDGIAPINTGVTVPRTTPPIRRERIMGADDKASNKVDDIAGKAKETVGKVTGNKDTENEGKFDQAKSSIKDAGEKVKDAFK